MPSVEIEGPSGDEDAPMRRQGRSRPARPCPWSHRLVRRGANKSHLQPIGGHLSGKFLVAHDGGYVDARRLRRLTDQSSIAALARGYAHRGGQAIQ
jgi:hypothetical protein